MSKIKQFPVGYNLEPVIFNLQDWEVQLYLASAGEANPLFENHQLVPPTAIAAFALRGVLKELGLPPGAIHIAHEMSFNPAVHSNQSIVFYARLTQNAVRSGWRFVTIDFHGLLIKASVEGKQVVVGRSTVVISEDS